MKLKTIWTIPAMTFGERVRRTIDAFAMNLAYHMPQRIRMWAMIHSINSAASTNPHAVVGSITVDQIMANMKGTN